MGHSFIFFFLPPRPEFLWTTWRVFLKTNREDLPHLWIWSMLLVFTGVQVAHLLLLRCTYYFRFMFFVVCVFFLVFVHGFRSFNFRCNLGFPDYYFLLRACVLRANGGIWSIFFVCHYHFLTYCMLLSSTTWLILIKLRYKICNA